MDRSAKRSARLAIRPFRTHPKNVTIRPAISDFRPIGGLNYTAGLLGIVIGTLAAILLLPDDYYEPGGLRLSVIVLAIGLVSGPLLSSMADQRVWIRAESVMMVGLVYWLLTEPLGTGYTAYELTRESVIKTFSLIGLFAALIQVGSKLAYLTHDDRSRISSTQQDFSREWLYWALVVCAVLGLMARLIPCSFSPSCMVDGLFGERGTGAWTRGAKGGSGAFVSHLAYFGYLTLPLTVALHHRIGRIDWRVLLGAVLTTIFLLYLVKDGGRRLVGMVMGAGFMTWLLLQPRVGFRQIIVCAAAGFIMLTLMQVMFTFRTLEGGIVSNLFSGKAFSSNPLEDGIRVDNNFVFLTRTVDLIPEFKDHTGWNAIIYWAARPIPRVLWPEKPISPGISIPYEMNEYWGENFTLTISAIGDWYISFGVYSVAIAALVMGYFGGKLVLIWMGPTVRQKLLYSLGLMWLFISLRSYLELILMSYPILALYLLGKLTLRRSQARANALPQSSGT